MLPFGEWCLGDERAQTGIVGLPGEGGPLLVGDGEVLSQVAQLPGDLTQSSLEVSP